MLKTLIIAILTIAFTTQNFAQYQLIKLEDYLLTPEECETLVPTNNDYDAGERHKKIGLIKKFFQDVSPYDDRATESYIGITDTELVYAGYGIKGNLDGYRLPLKKMYDDVYVIVNDKLKSTSPILDFDMVVIYHYSVFMFTISKNYNDEIVPNLLRVYLGGTNQKYKELLPPVNGVSNYADELTREWENDWGEDWTKEFVTKKRTKEYFDPKAYREKCWNLMMKEHRTKLYDFVKNFQQKVKQRNEESMEKLNQEIAAKKEAEAERIKLRDEKIEAFLEKYPEATNTMEENFEQWSAKGKPRLTYFVGGSGFLVRNGLNATQYNTVIKMPEYKQLSSRVDNSNNIYYKIEFRGEGPEADIQYKLSTKTGRNYITYRMEIDDTYGQMYGYNKNYFYAPCYGSNCNTRATSIKDMQDGMFWYKGNLIIFHDNSGGDVLMVYSYPGAEEIPAKYLANEYESFLWNEYVVNGLKLMQEKELIK
jgi:hypothetical protein